jgi:uncharacterized protein YegL
MSKKIKKNKSNQVKTYNLMILDKSGSMDSVRDVTISGLNEQLLSIKTSAKDYPDQEQIICLVTFSSNVNTDVWMKSIKDVDNFNRESYIPNGGTALFDAIGISITKLKNEIKDELSERKANVILTIFTDGDENASHEYNGKDVKTLIDKTKDSGQWTVAFLGCGENVFDVAEAFGITRGNTLCYNAGVDGTADAFKTMSAARTMRAASYSCCISKGLDTSKVNEQLDFFADTEKKTD